MLSLRGSLARVNSFFWNCGFLFTNLALTQTDAICLRFTNASATGVYVVERDGWLERMGYEVGSVGGSTGTCTLSIFHDKVTPGTLADAGSTYDTVLTAAGATLSGVTVFSSPIFLPKGTKVSLRYTTTNDWNGSSATADLLATLYFRGVA